MIIKKSHSSTGRYNILIFEVWTLLKPQTPFFVKIISQIIKNVPVIRSDGNRYLKFEA
tara:strand:+ start:281 stop:454 length:174 start_codon:yes stop_codon:yes gene_type:complete